MKVGDLVICTDNTGLSGTLVVPSTEIVYTIRKLFGGLSRYGASIGVLLEEIKNGQHPEGGEFGYLVKRFRVIDFPNDLVSEINEALAAPIKKEELSLKGD